MVSCQAFFGVAHEGDCIFCPERRSELEVIIHEDDNILAIKNKGLSGSDHLLIIPKRHIRDVESLTKADLPLLQTMDKVMKSIIEDKYSNFALSEIYTGYHRGHRPLGGWFGTFGAPDIISIQHLHLHVIVQPYWYCTWLKYPFWFPLMWISAESVMEMWNLTATTEVETGADDGK